MWALTEGQSTPPTRNKIVRPMKTGECHEGKLAALCWHGYDWLATVDELIKKKKKKPWDDTY